ncbi:hypothetical protein MBLNU459_g6814t1 [Dothideomycetes sp. NU459]
MDFSDSTLLAQPRPHLSITLPRSFEFHYTDGQLPQTPAPASAPVDVSEPPPPPKQTFKLRRRRADHSDNSQPSAPDSDALPTFEMTEPEHNSSTNTETSIAPGYLAPRPGCLRLTSPPRTPASQVTTYSTDSGDSNEWSMITRHSLGRPFSAASDFSDSSASSYGSSNESHPSMGGGSCTSPESDAADPFSFYEIKSGPPATSPLPSTELPTAKRVKTSRHPKWTLEMDNHLWVTYMVYVQDPRVTPFKMLPGTSPPLGVCHRVAREAKRAWKGQRNSQAEKAIPRISVQRVDSPDTIRPTPAGNSSPQAVAESRRSGSPKWPRSEAATRRRLRDLCKRKPSLSAHYQRLLRTRSPSPFESSSSSSPKIQPATQSSAFSSRSLNISLTEATAPSMQANGPLARLSHEIPKATPSSAVQRPADWFAKIGRSQARANAHQKSQSLQLGLGLGGSNTWSSSTFERGNVLASPFDSDVGRDHFLPGMNATQSLGRAYLNRRAENGSVLKSPLDLPTPMPTVRSLKRRFGVEEESSASAPSLQELFAAPPPQAIRPIRNRGFSLSDMRGATPQFTSLFTPPSMPDHPMGEAPDAGPDTNYLGPPRPVDPPRLGSPFGGSSSNARFNTFPRRFTPRESELPESPFEEKLRQLSTSSQGL